MVNAVSSQGWNSVEDQGRAQHTVVSVIEDGGDQGPALIVQQGDGVGQSIEKTKEN